MEEEVRARMTHELVTRESLTLRFYRVIKYFICHVSDTERITALETTRLLLIRTP